MMNKSGKGTVLWFRYQQSTTDITPKDAYLPCFVSGNPLRSEKTNKIHDRFECTVIVPKINKKLMVWGEIDIIEIDFKLADAMRKSIEKMYDVPYDNIIIGTIHTHTGPETLGRKMHSEWKK